MIEVPSDVLGYHDDIFNDIRDYLVEQGEMEPDEVLTSVSIEAKPGEPVTITEYSKKVIS